MSGTNLPAPFKFCTRRESVDWRRINAIDVDRVSGELDFQMLQEHIAGVAFCSLEGERCLNCQSHVDPALLKLFRLAQLTIQYLLHSQDCLALSLQTAQEQLQIEAKEKQHLQVQLQKQCQDGKLLKEELKQRKKIIASQQAMISAGLANYHKVGANWSWDVFFNMLMIWFLTSPIHSLVLPFGILLSVKKAKG